MAERVDAAILMDALYRCAAGSIKTLHRATVAGRPLSGRNAYVVPHMRLVVSLRGSRLHSFHGDNGVEKHRLGPGAAIAIWPGCWFGAWYETANRALSVVWRDHSLRVLLMEYRPEADVKRLHRARPEHAFDRPDALNASGHTLLRELMLAQDLPERYARNLIECLLHQTACSVAAAGEKQGRARDTWRRATDYVNEHCQHPISRQEVAEALGVHVNHLSRLFQQQGDTTFSRYLHARRMERARELLERTRLPVASVAQLSGFEDVRYFNRIFKRLIGVTPSDFRLRQGAPSAATGLELKCAQAEFFPQAKRK